MWWVVWFFRENENRAFFCFWFVHNKASCVCFRKPARSSPFEKWKKEVVVCIYEITPFSSLCLLLYQLKLDQLFKLDQKWHGFWARCNDNMTAHGYSLKGPFVTFCIIATLSPILIWCDTSIWKCELYSSSRHHCPHISGIFQRI